MGEDEKKQRKVMEGVAKYLRSKVPTKSAVIKGEKVEYFTGNHGNNYTALYHFLSL